MVETVRVEMAFTPREAPVYGGGLLEMNLPVSGEANLAGAAPEDELYLVLEGQLQVHVVTMQHSHDNYWLVPIPGHINAEKVVLTVVRFSIPKDIEKVAFGEFSYQYDSAFFLAEFLVNSVNDPHALDDLELIKSDHFDLANEVFSTLDVRLSAALKYIQFPEEWHMLGSEQDFASSSNAECRETLLHFAGRLGLYETALFLLTKAGSKEALYMNNSDGKLPGDVAMDYGFPDVAELFAGYNTNGMMKDCEQQFEIENGFCCSYGDKGSSITSYLDCEPLRSIEENIETLREFESKKCSMPCLHRQYDTEWPDPAAETSQNGQEEDDWGKDTYQESHHSFPSSQQEQPCHILVEQTLERICQNLSHHHDNIDQIVHESSPVHNNTHNIGRDQDLQSGISTSAALSSVSTSVGHTPQSNQPLGVLENSINSIKHINSGLQNLKDYTQHKKQHEALLLRRLHLGQLSSSCPALNTRLHSLYPIREGVLDQHKSMLDLGEDSGCKTVAEGSSSDVDIRHNFESFLQPDINSTEVDDQVRIFVNGVTVESSEDSVTVQSSPNRIVKLPVSGAHRFKQDELVRRRSWCLDSPLSHKCWRSSNIPDYKLTKSLSLNCLDQEEDSMEEDELYEDATDMFCIDHPTTTISQSPSSEFGVLTLCHNVTKGDAQQSAVERPCSPDYANVSPNGSASSIPTRRSTLERRNGIKRQLDHGLTAVSLTDLTIVDDQSEENKKTWTRSGAKTPGVLFGEEESELLCLPLSMTKSISTPSIPAATQAIAEEELKLSLRNGRREGKQPSGISQLVEKHVEDDEAQFRRQDEIEEEEDDHSSSGDIKEMARKDFSGEEIGYEKLKGDFHKEEKKRKPSVFERFQNSYRTKKQPKSKEKEGKVRHQFVAVSFSNTATCHVCHKSMANKPALRCENCLINVHEHNCKDQVPVCDKSQNSKKESSPTSSILEERQGPGSFLRTSQSFKKDILPISTQSKSQTIAASSQRHSLPSLSKAMNEECEVDGAFPRQEVVHTNIDDTISVSLESLDTVVPPETSFLDGEPDLMLTVEEPEAWNITADKKILKKMSTKDIKRQDTIWELIQTEKQYVKRLKIMQKLFRDRMLNDLHMPIDQIDRLFPRLDELFELHSNFLRHMLSLQTKNVDRSVDEIGASIIHQFSMANAEKMKSVYGVFCSKHTEAIGLYKEMIKTDRKFQDFCRKTSNHSVCEKRELQDFILGVTVRLSKYPILIEAILKTTKDKKDREHLSQALQYSKQVVHGVDEKVAAYEKLMDIYKSLDSRTTVYMGKKFKRQDLIARERYLIHAGPIGWKNARGRALDSYAVVLTDLILFLQKNEQKYTFFLQDNKSCVVPLYKLLVREKRDERDSHGIYLISQNRDDPEMYELVCRTREERDQWMAMLQEAVKNCPEEEVQQQEPITEDERKKQEEKSAKINSIIEQLHVKDQIIKECCDEKNRLLLELLDISASGIDTHLRPKSHRDFSSHKSVEVVQAAIQEAARLTTIIQGSGAQLSRSISSAGEHTSSSYVSMAVPKRAETFAGFAASYDDSKSDVALKQRFNQQYGEEDGRCPSISSLEGTDTDPQDYKMPPQEYLAFTPDKSSPALISHTGSSDRAHESTIPGNGEYDIVDRSHISGSHSNLSQWVASSPQPSAASEQMVSVVQLAHYLHSLMNMTTKQCTTVESLRAELAEAKEEINKLSTDMHGRKNIYRHNQLEELRNLQENLSRERQEWEKKKEKEGELIYREKERLAKQDSDLIAMSKMLNQKWQELQQYLSDPLNHSGHSDEGLRTAQQSVGQFVQGHRRSLSAEFQMPGTINNSARQEARRRPRQSINNVQNFGASNIRRVPDHLISTRNEQLVGVLGSQQLPLKLSSSTRTRSDLISSTGRLRPQAHSQQTPTRMLGRMAYQKIHHPRSIPVQVNRSQSSASVSTNFALPKPAKPKIGHSMSQNSISTNNRDLGDPGTVPPCSDSDKGSGGILI